MSYFEMKPGGSKIGKIKRRPISSTQTDWVKTQYLRDEGGPLIISPAVPDIDLILWADNNRAFLENSLLRCGAIIFRGFGIENAEDFERLTRTISTELLEYTERSSPRHQIYGRIYTSTDYPPSQSIFLHNENSYQQVWPMKLFFFCDTPAEQGGETPIADTRKVLCRLSRSTVDQFKKRKCMYVRNFDESLGLSWQKVFQTSDRSAVEQYCRQVNMSFEWKGNNRLKTCAVRQAALNHPKTGEEVWFNHVAFFHVTTLDATISEGLLSTVSEDDLPANTYYGDGAGIETSVLDEIRSAYKEETISFTWKKSDVLMIDNMLMAHSRAPYAGARKILVGMAEPFKSPSL